MAQDWDIKPRGSQCQQCGVAFEDQQPYHSALTFGSAGYQRFDYCRGCWPQVAAGTRTYSEWTGVYRKPPPEGRETLRKETAETLLRRLMQGEDPSRQNIIYILAVMLERTRLLVEKDVQNCDDGRMVRVYEHRKTGETFLVTDPRLKLDQLESVQLEVVAMLGGGEPAPAAAQPAEAPAAAEAPAEPAAAQAQEPDAPPPPGEPTDA